jgi:predicted lysophospholipase L1 biosynthesis ABC-type transport system permease subunit
VRAVLQREMPGASYVTVTPYSDVVGHAMKSWQLGATVFVAFGLLAMLLAAIGLYSAISYNVTQRTHEMGVRRALGAQAADVIQLVMRQALLLGGLGVVLGAVLAFVAADRIEPMLFKTSARDPLVFALVIVAMLGCRNCGELRPGAASCIGRSQHRAAVGIASVSQPGLVYNSVIVNAETRP